MMRAAQLRLWWKFHEMRKRSLAFLFKKRKRKERKKENLSEQGRGDDELPETTKHRSGLRVGSRSAGGWAFPPDETDVR
jgi:hypothetical protein